MLSFLNASVLFAAAAALIPLIIHLFSKRRVKIVEFSSLKHLKTMQRRQVRRLQIKQLLLLLIRMLIILAIVLAFARPTTRSNDIGAHAAVSAVIILDNSASMNRAVADGNLFELARARVGQLLENFGPSDEIALITVDRNDQTVPRFMSIAAAEEELDEITVGAQATTLQPALDMAVELLRRTDNLNKELYVVSDRQRRSLPETGLPEDLKVTTYLVDLPAGDVENSGLVALDFGGQLIRPGHDFELTATVRNFGSEPSVDQIASLYLDGNRVAQTDFWTEAGSETKITFKRSVSSPGLHSGWVELSDDQFLVDNRQYFSFRIPENFNLLIIEGDAGARYVSLALSPGNQLAQYWSVKTALPSELAGVDFNDYDAVMDIGCPILEDTYVSRLKAFVRRGRSLFVSYGGRTDLGWFNSQWSDLTGVVYDQAIPTNFSRAGYYTFNSANTDHPIFSVFNFQQSDLPEIKFFALPTMHVSGEASVLIDFSGGRPALVEQSYGSGRVVCLTTPIDPHYSDLVGHAFFVPLMSRLAEYLASDLSALDTKIEVGDVVSRSVTLPPGDVNYPLELITPDSNRFVLQPDETDGRLQIKTTPVTQVGIYQVTYLGRQLDRFAVNIEAAEGDLSQVDNNQMASALSLDQLTSLPYQVDLKPVIAGFRFGRELWSFFLWAAVLLLVAEIFLARGTRRDDTDN